MTSRNLAWIATALLAAVVLPGCSPAQKLVGKWQMDTSKAVTQATEGNPLAAAMAATMMSAMKFELDFQGDGNFAVSYNAFGQTGSESGSWRYLKSDGDVLVLMMKAKSDSAEREVRVRLVDDDHIEMVPPAGAAGETGKAMPFFRVKPK